MLPCDDGRSYNSGVMCCVWNSFDIHLFVPYFSSLRIKMAARDGDRPLWLAKHWQIPVFIHKPDLFAWEIRVICLLMVVIEYVYEFTDT